MLHAQFGAKWSNCLGGVRKSRFVICCDFANGKLETTQYQVVSKLRMSNDTSSRFFCSQIKKKVTLWFCSQPITASVL